MVFGLAAAGDRTFWTSWVGWHYGPWGAASRESGPSRLRPPEPVLLVASSAGIITSREAVTIPSFRIALLTPRRHLATSELSSLRHSR
jgi:hypothetical protein